MRRRQCDDPYDRGFTLIEVLVVVLIIGVLAAIAIPVYNNQRAKAWNTRLQADLRHVNGLIVAAGVEQGTYPSTGSLGVVYASAGCPNADNPRADYVPGLGVTLPQPPPGLRSHIGNAVGCYMYASNGTDYVLSAWSLVQGKTPQTGHLYRRLGFREMNFAGANGYLCNHANIGGNSTGTYNAFDDLYKWSYTISNITNCAETPPPGA